MPRGLFGLIERGSSSVRGIGGASRLEGIEGLAAIEEGSALRLVNDGPGGCVEVLGCVLRDECAAIALVFDNVDDFHRSVSSL